jgi:hypothetical protein
VVVMMTDPILESMHTNGTPRLYTKEWDCNLWDFFTGLSELVYTSCSRKFPAEVACYKS